MMLRAVVVVVLSAAACAFAQTASFSLAHYEVVRSFPLPLPIATEASGMTFNWDTGTLFVVGDEGFGIAEVTTAGELVSFMTFVGFEDPESITYIGNGQFVVAEERQQTAYRLTYVPGGVVERATLPGAALGPPVGNVGIEGISFEPATGLFFAVKEKNPQAVLRASINFAIPSAQVEPLFQPNLGVLDLSGIQVLSMVPILQGTPSEQNLLIISQESGVLIEVTRTGQVVSQFDISSLSTTAEGVTMGFDGTIYICDESPRVFVLEPVPLRMQIAGAGLPPLMPLNEPIEVRVYILPGMQAIAPGSARVHFRASAGGLFESVPLLPVSGGQPGEYRAVLPAFECGAAPEVYFTASGDLGASVRLPRNEPEVFRSQVGVLVPEPLLVTRLETMWPAGWLGTGLWHITSACAPSGNVVEGCEVGPHAYFGRTVTCNYVLPAGAHAGTLTAPPIPLPAVTTAESISLSFCYALETENSPFLDIAELLVNGQSRPAWRLPDVVPTAAEPNRRWARASFDLTEFAGQTVTLAWRFNTVSALNNAFRGWHLNDVRVEALLVGCPAGACYANCDGSTADPILNIDDFTCFINAYAAALGEPYEVQVNSYANCDRSTTVPVLNIDDFTCFVNAFAVGCP